MIPEKVDCLLLNYYSAQLAYPQHQIIRKKLIAPPLLLLQNKLWKLKNETSTRQWRDQ